MVFPLFHRLLLFKVTEYRCEFQCHISVSGVGSSLSPTPGCLATALSSPTPKYFLEISSSLIIYTTQICISVLTHPTVCSFTVPLLGLLVHVTVAPISVSPLPPVPVLYLNTLCECVPALLSPSSGVRSNIALVRQNSLSETTIPPQRSQILPLIYCFPYSTQHHAMVYIFYLFWYCLSLFTKMQLFKGRYFALFSVPLVFSILQ